jgi:hypothetical protein
MGLLIVSVSGARLVRRSFRCRRDIFRMMSICAQISSFTLPLPFSYSCRASLSLSDRILAWLAVQKLSHKRGSGLSDSLGSHGPSPRLAVSMKCAVTRLLITMTGILGCFLGLLIGCAGFDVPQ